ncbi:MAG: response regulator transcription factor [Candidatus Riflebacteria bacterium]|nr:response regulator transcription factor [Candidatus Riflebacteria bacterium]
MRLLLIDDEDEFSGFLESGLTRWGYAVGIARCESAGEQMAQAVSYDVILLGQPLPNRSGLVLCRLLRARNVKTPIIMFSPGSTLQERIAGLDGGADDYLDEPFALEELLAKIRALFRRHAAELAQLQIGDLVLDRARRRARRGDKEIELTQREYTLLECFMTRPGEVLSRTVLAGDVWNTNLEFESNVIDVTVAKLRHKIDRGAQVRLIQTVRGHGYMLAWEEESPPEEPDSVDSDGGGPAGPAEV